MSAFKLQTLKQKLWAIVAASFVARVIVFFALPNTPSSLAPDEGTYGLISSWVARGILSEQLYFYQNLYYTGRSLLLPSSFLADLGVSGLASARVMSSIYGLSSLILLVLIVSHLHSNHKLDAKNKRPPDNLIVILFLVYAFLPSHFIWSTLGLRESTNEFWLILVFLFTYFFYKDVSKRILFTLTLLVAAIILVFSSRPQVGLLVCVSLIVYSLTKLKDVKTYLFVPAVLVGLMGGYLFTTPTIYFSENAYTVIEVFPPTATKDPSPTATKDPSPTATKDPSPTATKDPSPTATKVPSPTATKDPSPTATKDPSPTPDQEISLSKLCNFEGQELVSIGKKYVCEKSKTPAPLQEASIPNVDLIESVSALSEGQKARQFEAASRIPTINCPFDEKSRLSNYACLIWRAPYASFTFLFRPLPLLDTTSVSSILASIENIIWMFGIGSLLYLLIVKRRFSFKTQALPSVIFLALYAVGAGSYEGNMGTAFRHKSLILWIILLLLAVFWRTQGCIKEPRGNNSQESAV